MAEARLFAVTFGALLLGACSSSQNMPLIFGQQQTVGISIGASTTDQGGEFVLGYKDKNIAIVPVTVIQKDGSSTLVKSVVAGKDAKTPSTDAMSVLGQFEVSSDTKSNNVSLGKFFATGLAAQKLADGFKEKIKE
jgi:hypothetical protein